MAGARGIRAGAAYVEIFGDDSRLQRSLKGLRSSFDSVGRKIAGVSSIFAGGAALGGAALAWPLKMAANLEKTEAAFTTILKDGNRAKALLNELRDFAASTPFQFTELADAGKKLLAFGTSANEVTNELRRIGDVSSAIGEPIGEIAEIYGKARVQGRLFAEDINQLTGRGIPIIEELSKVLNLAPILDENGKVAVSAGAQLREMVKEGEVGFKELEQAFKNLTKEGGKFAGGMEKQSKTLLGVFSTLKDNIELAFRPFGEALLPMAREAVSIATKAVQVFAKWAERNKGLAVGIAAAVAAVGALGAAGLAASAVFIGLGTVMGALSTVAGLVGSAIAAIASPIGLIVGGVAAIGAGLAYVAHRAGLIMPALQFLRESFGRVFGTVREALGGVVAALSSGQWGQAAKIAWAGVRLASLQGAQQVLMGIESLWNNAGIITAKFLATMNQMIYSAFKAIPKLAFAALRGGAAFQAAIQESLGGFFSGDSNFLSGRLDPAIARARQDLNVQLGQVRGGRAGAALNRAGGNRPIRGGGQVLADPRMLAALQRQTRIQQRMLAEGGLQ